MESVSVQYLSANEQDRRWGMTISTVGHQRIGPGAPYPSANHPFLYLFDTNRGRILDEYQLVYITEGTGTFESAHCRRCTISGGQFFMLFPGEWHSYRPDSLTGWCEHWIGFKGEMMENLIRQGFFSIDKPVSNVGQSQEIIDLYISAAQCAKEQRTGFQQMLAGSVNMLLGYCYSKDRETYFEEKDVVSCIHHAKQYIAANFQSDLKPEAIAREVGMSYSNFRKLFKQYTGYSSVAYIEEIRLIKSKELLANTNLTSQEIAYRTGFNTPYYFSIRFKRSTGMSPVEYRKVSRGEQVRGQVSDPLSL